MSSELSRRPIAKSVISILYESLEIGVAYVNAPWDLVYGWTISLISIIWRRWMGRWWYLGGAKTANSRFVFIHMQLDIESPKFSLTSVY